MTTPPPPARVKAPPRFYRCTNPEHIEKAIDGCCLSCIRDELGAPVDSKWVAVRPPEGEA